MDWVSNITFNHISSRSLSKEGIWRQSWSCFRNFLTSPNIRVATTWSPGSPVPASHLRRLIRIYRWIKRCSFRLSTLMAMVVRIIMRGSVFRRPHWSARIAKTTIVRSPMQSGTVSLGVQPMWVAMLRHEKPNAIISFASQTSCSIIVVHASALLANPIVKRPDEGIMLTHPASPQRWVSMVRICSLDRRPFIARLKVHLSNEWHLQLRIPTCGVVCSYNTQINMPKCNAISTWRLFQQRWKMQRIKGSGS